MVIKKTPEYDFQLQSLFGQRQILLIGGKPHKMAIKTLLGNMDSSQIGGIGLTGQMHGMVALDEGGNVLEANI